MNLRKERPSVSRWQKGIGPRGEPLLERTPRKDLEKMPVDSIIKLLSEAWPKTVNRGRAFSRDRKSIDFALNLLVKKYATISEQYDDAHTLNLTKDHKIGSLGKELQKLQSRREKDVVMAWGDILWTPEEENDDSSRENKTEVEELAKRDKIITELKEQLVIKEANERRVRGIFVMYDALFKSMTRLGENHLLSKAVVDRSKCLFTYSLSLIKWKDGNPVRFALDATRGLYEDDADYILKEHWDPATEAAYFQAWDKISADIFSHL